MRLLKVFLVLFFTAVVMICCNMFGYGFTKPIKLSFEVQSTAASETRIFYKNHKQANFTRGMSVQYLIKPEHAQDREFHKVSITLNNINVINSLRFSYDASNDNTICYRNVKVSNLLTSTPIVLGGGTLDGIESPRLNGEDFCFDVLQELSDATGITPTINVDDLQVYTQIDYYSYWQAVLALGVFSMLYFVVSLFRKRSNYETSTKHKKSYNTFSHILFQLFIIAIFITTNLYVINEVLTAYNVHQRLLVLIALGMIEFPWLIAMRRLFSHIEHAVQLTFIFILLLLVRYAVFKEHIGTIYANEFLGYLHIVKQDIVYDVLVVLLLSTAYRVRRPFLKYCSVLAVFCGLLVMFYDFIINTYNRSARLMFSDFTPDRIIETLSNFKDMITKYIGTGQSCLTLCIILLVIFAIKTCLSQDSKSLMGWKRFIVYIAIYFLALWAYNVNIGTSSVFDDKFYNVIEINNSGENLNFGRMNSSSSEMITTKQGLNNHKNVILLSVDSLSSFKSKLYGGEDWTPGIDELAQKNVFFSNFYSSAYSSSIAHLAMLTGIPYLHNGSSLQSEELYTNTLTKHLQSNGYKTMVVYSAAPTSIDFDIFKLAGFDFWVDYKNRHYPSDLPRYSREGVDSKAFLNNSLGHVEYWMKNKMKFFAYMISSFSSSPYRVPIDLRKNPTQEEFDLDRVLYFTDEAVVDFVDNLKRIGFFDNGTLIIVGNHRADVSLTKKEFDEYGMIALARVPCIIIDKDLGQKQYNNDMSILSLPELIEYLTLPSYQSSSAHVNPLVDHDINEVIIYQKSAPRNVILLKNGDSVGQFLINGMGSKIVGNLKDKDRIFGDVLYLLKEKVYLPKNAPRVQPREELRVEIRQQPMEALSQPVETNKSSNSEATVVQETTIVTSEPVATVTEQEGNVVATSTIVEENTVQQAVTPQHAVAPKTTKNTKNTKSTKSTKRNKNKKK